MFLGCAANSSGGRGGPRLPTGAEAEGDPSAGGSAAQSQRAGPPDGLGRPPQPVLQKQQQQGADRPLRRRRRSRGPAEGHGLGGDAETADRCTLALGHQQAVEMCQTGGGGGGWGVHICDNHSAGEPIRSITLVSNFCLWRETEDGARTKPEHKKTIQSNKNEMITHEARTFFLFF